MWWECCSSCPWYEPAELAHSFLFCSCVCFCPYGPSNCISFHKFSQQLSAFSLCSSGLTSALLVLSTRYLFMKVSLSPDIILCGWLGLKHQQANELTRVSSCCLYLVSFVVAVIGVVVVSVCYYLRLSRPSQPLVTWKGIPIVFSGISS